jgi:DNA (cytosine-5)-methyltransferase 1
MVRPDSTQITMKAAKRNLIQEAFQSSIKLPPKSIGGRRLTVLDLFCGAGGFSEGFRSVGCTVVAGIDYWRPAVDTFNCNFGLEGKPVNILSFEGNVELIDKLPDTDIIIGSPPCVSFSYSNKLGNADKTEGLRLMKIFFSIVTIKKFKSGSRLLAWYMENVTNAIKWLPDAYSFADLGLSCWAILRGLSPTATAIDIKNNAVVLNAAEVGVAQTRKRLFVGEIHKKAAKRRGFRSASLKPPSNTTTAISAGAVRSRLPAPNCKVSSRRIRDPIYKNINIPLRQLTDHFYETGAYEIHWRDSRLLKTSHPYMGKMAFPENERKPSRTIVASPFPRSREALLYKSEWKRIGNGEYRGPTIREASTLMSFPITYQFIGSEGAKWRLVGNAVCPQVSRALAVRILKALGVKRYSLHRKKLPKTLSELPNLNTFSPRKYDKPPTRHSLARFRSHAFKAASMTVALTNYDVVNKGSGADGKWRCFVTYGIGEGYKIQRVDLRHLKRIRRAVEEASPRGTAFIEHITNGFSETIPSAAVLQELYEKNVDKRRQMLNPHRLLEEVKEVTFKFADRDQCVDSEFSLFLKKSVPVSQLYALFAVCHIVSMAKAKGEAAQ